VKSEQLSASCEFIQLRVQHYGHWTTDIVFFKPSTYEDPHIHACASYSYEHWAGLTNFEIDSLVGFVVDRHWKMTLLNSGIINTTK
jgi:hypothetical protein